MGTDYDVAYITTATAIGTTSKLVIAIDVYQITCFFFVYRHGQDRVMADGRQ